MAYRGKVIVLFFFYFTYILTVSHLYLIVYLIVYLTDTQDQKIIIKNSDWIKKNSTEF